MKKIKQVRIYVIYQMTEKEMKESPYSSEYKIFLKEDLEHGVKFASVEWECDSLEEALEWIN